MLNKGVHGIKVHLTNLHTWNLHGKFKTFLILVKTVLVPFLKTGHDSIEMLFFQSICI